MMRRTVLAGAALALALTGCAQVPPGGSTPPESPAPGPSAPGPSAPTAVPSTPPGAAGTTCQDRAAALSLAEQAGQLVMVSVTDELDAAERAALAEDHLGSVILMGTSQAGVTGTRSRVDAITAAGGDAGVLVAVDQEGGLVQRLKGPGFDTIPPAREQATMTAAELTASAARWGEQLADAGVHLDLAPVADVVPAAKASTNEPIGKLGRGYGSTPAEVSEKVTAFVAGLQQAGVASSVKHFPNLGQVEGNTDFSAGVADDVTTADDPALEPYHAAIAQGVETVMLSTAVYTRIDPDAPAAFSPTVISIVRDDLAFGGVIVSDDLGVAEAVADVPASERGVRFVRAGGDLAISVDVAAARSMARGLVEAAESDPELRERVTASAARVLALKGQLGVLDCEAVLG